MMLRNILAAIVGYIAIVAVLFALSSLLWLVLGASRSFQPGTWEVASGWILGSIAIGFVGAYIGGRVCARMAHDAKGALILIGILVVLGVVSILIPVEAATGPRPDDVGMLEATMSANQPTWLTWLNPVIGVVGIWLGSRKLRA
ncbi:MAG: hypothetical protein OXI39_09500 [Gemmatimonadota bacterium]|uniref:hypothetical protein n=1 Tax=Candidatus Palauibacter scopulicola TaxID=3056741 RepID=UPI002387EE91|nr:hypothetical protein [Candidatus Palauibacter scopulicola]MDE2663220.1 hypothetical protein [Candidatus Palauibacter scopulicola]